MEVSEGMEVMKKIKKGLKGKVEKGKIVLEFGDSDWKFTVAYCVLSNLIK